MEEQVDDLGLVQSALLGERVGINAEQRLVVARADMALELRDEAGTPSPRLFQIGQALVQQ